MPARQLDRLHAETCPCDAVRPRRIHDPILGADDRHRLDVRPRIELGCLRPHRSLEAPPADSRLGDFRGAIGVQDAPRARGGEPEAALIVERERVAQRQVSISVFLRRGFEAATRCTDDARNHHHATRRDLCGDERHDEGAEPRTHVIARQIRRRHVMTGAAESCGELREAPAAVARAVQQEEVGHAQTARQC